MRKRGKREQERKRKNKGKEGEREREKPTKSNNKIPFTLVRSHFPLYLLYKKT